MLQGRLAGEGEATSLAAMSANRASATLLVLGANHTLSMFERYHVGRAGDVDAATLARQQLPQRGRRCWSWAQIQICLDDVLLRCRPAGDIEAATLTAASAVKASATLLVLGVADKAGQAASILNAALLKQARPECKWSEHFPRNNC